jgi:hypothetical protein
MTLKIQFLALFLALNLTLSCGKITSPSAKDVPSNAQERARKNVEEGRGISVGGLLGGGRGSTNYEFSTSNPMWRASLEILDFLPLSTVDYSGGIIITDWYNDESNSSKTNSSIKITVRFLSNEIRSDSFKVIVHQKTCGQGSSTSCRTNSIESKIKEELTRSILVKAASIEQKQKKQKK